MPAVLAIAEQDERSGAAVLAATVAGIEAECRLGALVNPRHYQAGFHATGTLGTFGAAAGVAWLLALEHGQWLHAMGLAGTQAAGLKSAFGTMAKPLHAGKAAADGLLAALLARGGFTANPAIIEAEQGFALTHHGGAPDGERLAKLEGRFLIRDTLFKYHAACYLTHSAIEGALALRAELPPPSGIHRVRLEVAPSSLTVCNIPRPVTGLEGKFSLRATTAMALLGDDTGDAATYSDARMTDPELVSLRDRVEVQPVEGVSPTQTGVLVETDLGTHRAAVDVGRPASDLDLQWQRLSAKFFALATPVVGRSRAEALRDAVASLDTLSSVRQLLALATPGTRDREKTA
jgi:2-methylcitrate dehydratase PrpD